MDDGEKGYVRLEDERRKKKALIRDLFMELMRRFWF